ncbi:MAG: hypothetical protein LBJ25_08230 [Candidatus Margulisbacteria bacterium]|jgi:hypothetical protein|nr:hypothetical protein [Candidatus Margulisiibacteriota bacterium]
MRKGFIYVRLQIYFALLVLVIGSALFLTWDIVRRDWQLHARLKENLLAQNVLDKMTEDLKYADSVNVYADRAQFAKDGAEYTYLLNNQRLARRKDAYLYLTPAKMPLRALHYELQDGLLEIILHGEKQTWVRLVRL